jgi:hypothetical protein
LTANYTRDDKLGLIKSAVYVMAHALHDLLCHGVNGRCDLGRAISGSDLKDLLFNVSFFRRGFGDDWIAFDDRGDPPSARYSCVDDVLLAPRAQ